MNLPQAVRLRKKHRGTRPLQRRQAWNSMEGKNKTKGNCITFQQNLHGFWIHMCCICWCSWGLPCAGWIDRIDWESLQGATDSWEVHWSTHVYFTVNTHACAPFFTNMYTYLYIYIIYLSVLLPHRQDNLAYNTDNIDNLLSCIACSAYIAIYIYIYINISLHRFWEDAW